MNSIIHISEAANLGLHTMLIVAGRAGTAVSVKDAATTLGVSKNHLAKVLQEDREIAQHCPGPKRHVLNGWRQVCQRSPDGEKREISMRYSRGYPCSNDRQNEAGEIGGEQPEVPRQIEPAPPAIAKPLFGVLFMQDHLHVEP